MYVIYAIKWYSTYETGCSTACLYILYILMKILQRPSYSSGIKPRDLNEGEVFLILGRSFCPFFNLSYISYTFKLLLQLKTGRSLILQEDYFSLVSLLFQCPCNMIPQYDLKTSEQPSCYGNFSKVHGLYADLNFEWKKFSS